MATSVVLYVSCDLCGDKYSEDEKKTTKQEWNWNGSNYQFDVDEKCFSSLGTRTLTELLDASVSVERKPIEKSRSTRSRNRRRSPYRVGALDGPPVTEVLKVLYDQVSTADGKFECPILKCHYVASNRRGVGSHLGVIHRTPIHRALGMNNEKIHKLVVAHGMNRSDDHDYMANLDSWFGDKRELRRQRLAEKQKRDAEQ